MLLIAFLTVSLAAAPSATIAASQPVTRDDAAIGCATSSASGLAGVWARYLEGLRRGDLARLRSVFAAQGMFHRLTETGAAGTKTLSGQTFADALPRWAADPDPRARGTIREATVVQDMGVIKGRLTFGGTVFDDVLTLYCERGRWQIVGKLTHAGPER